MELQKGTMVGYGAVLQEIHVGDRVDHVEKEHLKGGIVSGTITEYKGEIAVLVRFPQHPAWKARVSKLIAAPTPKVKALTLEDFGYEVGDQVAHRKYTHLTPLTIMSEKVGEYRGEPCCFTEGNRATRFSQIEMYVEPEPDVTVDDDDLDLVAEQEIILGLETGQKLRIRINVI